LREKMQKRKLQPLRGGENSGKKTLLEKKDGGDQKMITLVGVELEKKKLGCRDGGESKEGKKESSGKVQE